MQETLTKGTFTCAVAWQKPIIPVGICAIWSLGEGEKVQFLSFPNTPPTFCWLDKLMALVHPMFLCQTVQDAQINRVFGHTLALQKVLYTYSELGRLCLGS